MVTTLKITSIGNSLGMILPKELLARFHLEKGDELHLMVDTEGFRLLPHDKDFLHQMKLGMEIMREDRDVLKLLAQ